MKKTILFFLAIFSFSLAMGQIGIRSSQLFHDAPKWTIFDNTGIQEEIHLGKGISFGLDYWFRLKNNRIEFYPELNYAQLTKNWENVLDLKLNMYSIYLNTQIYFLDFAGDCDCPTFSKEGTFIDRGLFLLLSPGYSLQRLETKQFEGLEENVESNAFNFGAGLGLDIGISDAITITPYAGARYFFSALWHDFRLDTFFLDDNQSMFLKTRHNSFLQIFAGIRVGFRFDEF